jgi:hypothetical protein
MLQGKLEGRLVADDEGQLITYLGTSLSVLRSANINDKGRTSKVGHSPIPASK